LGLAGVWRAILRMAEAADAQVFATTHSQECIDAAGTAFATSQEAFRLYRVRRSLENPDRTEVVSYSPSELASAQAMDLEVR
jgi:hypothetical protein